jgi:hypothetical protein
MITAKRTASFVVTLSALAFAASLATPAAAGPNCTNEPKEKWMSEAGMKAKIAEMGYQNIQVFKVTSGNCYEMYGFTKDGKKAEVYFHPITGVIVEEKVG